MKNQFVTLICVFVLLCGCKKEESSSSSSTTNNQGNNGDGNAPNYVLDNYIGTYSGTLKEIVTNNGTSNTYTGQQTIEFKKLSDTEVKFSAFTGTFSNGKIVFPKQQVYIGSIGYNASGTAELASDNNLKVHLDFKDGVVDNRTQDFDVTRD